MKYWNKIPLFRLLIPLILGILSALYSDFTKDIFICITLVLFAFILSLIYFSRFFSAYKNRWEQIKKECLKLDIPFYNVSTEGAYLFEIKT